MRAQRIVPIPAFRGLILDRDERVLAISVAMPSVAIDPKSSLHEGISGKDWVHLSHCLGKRPEQWKHEVWQHRHQSFWYLARRVPLSVQRCLMHTHFPGILWRQEYRRFYPQGESTAQLLGMTNINDEGIEGIELRDNDKLRSQSGVEKIVKDRFGHAVETLAHLRDAHPGEDVILSIDARIQALAYEALKTAVKKYQAKSGAVMVLDPHTGEILAAVSQPSFYPNQWHLKHLGSLRQRVFTDLFEPGSALKVFTAAMALESGKFHPGSQIETAPGWMVLNGHRIHDTHFLGKLSIQKILQKSSNVGIARLALDFPAMHLLHTLEQFGFGHPTESGFPGEQGGYLPLDKKLSPLAQATLSFGYGLSVTTAQLAKAYGILASGGKNVPMTLYRVSTPSLAEPVISEKVARDSIHMLESVVSSEGTAPLARVPGYRVAGKTGTTRVVDRSGYTTQRHNSFFVGLAPVSHPRFVVAVVIGEPQGRYYGGVVAAPVFAKIMQKSLQLEGVPKDGGSLVVPAKAGISMSR